MERLLPKYPSLILALLRNDVEVTSSLRQALLQLSQKATSIDMRTKAARILTRGAAAAAVMSPDVQAYMKTLVQAKDLLTNPLKLAACSMFAKAAPPPPSSTSPSSPSPFPVSTVSLQMPLLEHVQAPWTKATQEMVTLKMLQIATLGHFMVHQWTRETDMSTRNMINIRQVFVALMPMLLSTTPALRKAASVALLKLVRVPAFEAQVLMCRYVC
jgi:hypothetical protein